MTLVVEITLWDWPCVILGVAALLSAILGGLGYPKPAQLLRSTPLALALLGAASIMLPIAPDVSAQAPVWVTAVVYMFWFALMVGGAKIDYRAKHGLPHNQSLQQTLDPAADSADAEPSSASSAAEPRRYVSRPRCR